MGGFLTRGLCFGGCFLEALCGGLLTGDPTNYVVYDTDMTWLAWHEKLVSAHFVSPFKFRIKP